MKFIWSLVRPCYGRVAASEVEEESGAGTRLPEDDANRPFKRRKRRTRPEWTPKLCSITEDRVVLVEKARICNKVEEKMAIRTKSGSVQVARRPVSGAQVHVRRCSGDYGGVTISAAFPAFSPAPFIF